MRLTWPTRRSDLELFNITQSEYREITLSLLDGRTEAEWRRGNFFVAAYWPTTAFPIAKGKTGCAFFADVDLQS